MDSYTATVEYAEYSPSHGDYVATGNYTIPSFCPTCREKRGNSSLLYRKIDLSEARLTLIGWVKEFFGLLEHPKDPAPPQTEQVDMLLERIGHFEEPRAGGFDAEIFEDRDARPFYYAYCRLDDEHFNELCTRAWREYDVRVPGLVYRGQRYLQQNDQLKEMNIEPKEVPWEYNILPHRNYIDSTGVYTAIQDHDTELLENGHELEQNEVILDGEAIPHVPYTHTLSDDDFGWGYLGAGSATTARSILEHAIDTAEDPPDVDPAAAWRDLRGFDAYTPPEMSESGPIITPDEVMEFLRQQEKENESED